MDLELGLVVASEVDGSHGDGDGGGDGVRVTFWHSVKKEVGPGKRKIRDSDVKIKIYIFILINLLIYLNGFQLETWQFITGKWVGPASSSDFRNFTLKTIFVYFPNF